MEQSTASVSGTKQLKLFCVSCDTYRCTRNWYRTIPATRRPVQLPLVDEATAQFPMYYATRKGLAVPKQVAKRLVSYGRLCRAGWPSGIPMAVVSRG